MSDAPLDSKAAVHDFWNDASCGEALLLEREDRAGYDKQRAARYALEPYIPSFAKFDASSGLDVLEIGVGLGADHQGFAEAGATCTGIDLTERAIAHTQRRFAAFGLQSALAVGDAENLAFKDAQFDVVYSWGVLHHSPNTPKAIDEVWRVLRPGGVARIMIYHRHSLIGFMLWLRYGLFAGRPFIGWDRLYDQYLESPGTKAYSTDAARALFSRFDDVRIGIELSHGDLLSSGAGQRHRGFLLTLARAIWPRWFIRRFLPKAGLFMLIEARKP